MREKSPKVKHTPGPWAFGAPAHNAFVSIFEKMPEHSAPSHIARIGGVGDSRPVEERDANARLIASAPELLEALKDAEFLLRKVSINPKEISGMLDSLKRSASDAQAAIAKAEGRHV